MSSTSGQRPRQWSGVDLNQLRETWVHQTPIGFELHPNRRSGFDLELMLASVEGGITVIPISLNYCCAAELAGALLAASEALKAQILANPSTSQNQGGTDVA